jgi:hypothetical protein
MKNPVFIFVAFFFVLTFPACKKAGTGGKATLIVSLKHHEEAVVSTSAYLDTVYVKFNTEELPSDPTHNYDALFVGTPGTNQVTCADLKTGKYYLYGTGFDTTENIRVTGGMAYQVKYKERKKEVSVDLHVTEE